LVPGSEGFRPGRAGRSAAACRRRPVFGNLQTQPLKVVWVRALIRNQLALPGWPQMMLPAGVARTTLSTGRRADRPVAGRSAARA
jgi:hypothetical protein